MSSKIAFNDVIQIDPNDSDMTLFLPIRSSSHRTFSFSSISSLSSNSSVSSFCCESPFFSSKTPLQSTRVPFSWEKLPGIPKKQFLEESDLLSNLLPLPPAGNQFADGKLKSQEIITKYNGEKSKKDPFFVALVECSKDHDLNQQNDHTFGKISKMTRSLSQGFSLVSISGSCKSTCAVSESMIFVPKYQKHNLALGHGKERSKSSSRFNSAFP